MLGSAEQLNTIFDEPYLSTDLNHQGLILHAMFHRPNGRDYIPNDLRIPCGEATMWGDYHAREAARHLQRVYGEKPYLAFFGQQVVTQRFLRWIAL